MNDILKAIRERRSIRKFKSEMPKKEDLEQIAEAGLYAANGMGRQSAIIVAVTNREWRDKLSVANCSFGPWEESYDPFYGAPVVFAVLADPEVPTCVCDGSLVLGKDGRMEGLSEVAWCGRQLYRDRPLCRRLYRW